MVFMRKGNKGAKPNQKVQGKKPFQKEADMDMSDDDFDVDDMDSGDDSDDAIVTKTPKGKQSLSEKRVSFQVPGKNTPAKTPVGKKQATPAKDNSVSKKQVTPGKGGLQKFKGMEQQNQKSKKGSQLDDDDDEDDDDDDDDEDDSDFGGNIDLSMGGDDDDDDEDDDEDEEDDEDDDDDDDDEEDEEENHQKSSPIGKNQKQNVVQGKQTPSKGNEKQGIQTPKGSQTPKPVQTPKSKVIQTPKKETSAVSPKANPVVALDEERRRKRDAVQLYVGNLPKEVNVAEVKALSTDIVSVSLPKRQNATHAFAFLQFASEEKAEENFKLLKSKTFKGASLNVDYVGSKSTHQAKDNQAQLNPKKLFVSGLPLDVTVHQVAKFFPKCHTVTLNQASTYRAATVSFWTDEDGTAAFKETKEIEIKGVKASVLHSRQSKHQKTKSKRKKNAQKNKKDNGHPAKKMKFMKKEESSDDDDE